MARIFISYRRDDSAGHVGWMRSLLIQRFGADEIFHDINTIAPGVDFVEAIEEAVGSCDVLLAVIGPRWLTATDTRGQRRLENPEDFVRVEIVAALDRNIRVIPVLVQDAPMPRSDELPQALARLARRQAMVLRDSSWDYDVGRLIAALEAVLQPRQLDALFSQLLEAEAQKNWDAVIALGEQILEIDPNHQSSRAKTATAYNNRGLAQHDQGNLTAAIEDYDQAIRFNPNYAAPYNNRGNARKAQGDLTRAMEDYNQAIRLDPNHAVAYYNCGVARHDQGNLTAAIEDYDQAIRSNPNMAVAYYNRGLAWHKQGNLTAAVEDYDQAIRLDPNDAVAYYNRGYVYLVQNNQEAARRDFERAAQLGYEDAKKELAKL